MKDRCRILPSLADQSLKFLEIVERPRTLRELQELDRAGHRLEDARSTALFSSVFRHVNVLLQVFALRPLSLCFSSWMSRFVMASSLRVPRSGIRCTRSVVSLAATPDALWRSDSAHARNLGANSPSVGTSFRVGEGSGSDGANAFRRSTRSRAVPHLWAADFESLTFLRLRISVPSGRLIRTSTSNPPLFGRSARVNHRYLSVGDGLRCCRATIADRRS